jgi:CCR4-NOT transcription complex subunit 7/8
VSGVSFSRGGILPPPLLLWAGLLNRRSSEDMFAPESVELLQKSGIDFQRHEEIGIHPNDFSELMITSGLVLTDETRWISFHRCVVPAIPSRNPLS